ncbi:MAG: oligosaccharide flippase family protein [Gemmatimonadaceae bacterium]|nr:oligosaccharide flippase family protein [Gemmatimonadaceae bacterium]
MSSAVPPPRSGASRGVLTGAAQTFVASVLPLALALLALPVLTRALGAERIALLALAWSWLAIVQLLDFGLGRALVRRLAEADAHGQLADEGHAVRSAERALLVVSSVVAIAGCAVGTWYVRRQLGLPAALRDDATWSTLLFCAAVPATVAAAAPRAALEAARRFGEVSLVRGLVNAATFAVPLALLPITQALWVTAALLLVVRLWAWWRLRSRAARLVTLHAPARAGTTPALLRDGTWITVSNVLSPLLAGIDRFVIGALLGAAAVAHYAVPYEVVTKAWIVPSAVCASLFPAVAFARVRAASEVAALHALALRVTAALVLPAMTAALVAAPLVLVVLAGGAWPASSARVLAWLAIGTAANSLAIVPFVLLQATGRARAVALVNVVEVGPYLVALWVGLQVMGIEGAAIAWTARATVDLVAVAWLAARHVPPSPGTWPRLVIGAGGLVTAAALVLAHGDVTPWLAVALVALVTIATMPPDALRLLRARLAGAS